MMSSTYCRCSEASPCSSAVWISPWPVVGLCFHLWGALAAPPGENKLWPALHCQGDWEQCIGEINCGVPLVCLWLQFILELWHVLINYTKALLSIRSTCTAPLPTCNHSLQFSALTNPWGGFVSNGPHWGQLTLQDTWVFASDFNSLSDWFNLLTVSEVQGFSTKYTMGLIKIQKALTSYVPSINFLQGFQTCTANWRGFRSLLKVEEFNEHLIKKRSFDILGLFRVSVYRSDSSFLQLMLNQRIF